MLYENANSLRDDGLIHSQPTRHKLRKYDSVLAPGLDIFPRMTNVESQNSE